MIGHPDAKIPPTASTSHMPVKPEPRLVEMRRAQQPRVCHPKLASGVWRTHKLLLFTQDQAMLSSEIQSLTKARSAMLP